MAKKDKKAKKKDKGGTVDTVEAVRSAVERTFQATAEGAQSTRGRAQDLLQDVTAAAQRVRELFEESRVLEDLKGLRREIELLARRVADLEVRGSSRSEPEAGEPAPATPAEGGTAARRSPARTSAARKPGTAARKSPARSTGTRKTAAAKPAASRPRASAAKPTVRKPASTRRRSASDGSGSGSPPASESGPDS